MWGNCNKGTHIKVFLLKSRIIPFSKSKNKFFVTSGKRFKIHWEKSNNYQDRVMGKHKVE